MSEDWGFAAPPFKPDEALQRLRRELRELGLTERAGVFERRGTPIARAAVDGATIAVALVERPSRRSPQWRPRTLTSSAEQRAFVTHLKQQLGAWSEDDD